MICKGGEYVDDKVAISEMNAAFTKHQQYMEIFKNRRITSDEAKRMDTEFYIGRMWMGGWGYSYSANDRSYLCSDDAELTALLLSQIDLWNEKPKNIGMLLNYIQGGTCDEGKARAYKITVDRLKETIKGLAGVE